MVYWVLSSGKLHSFLPGDGAGKGDGVAGNDGSAGKDSARSATRCCLEDRAIRKYLDGRSGRRSDHARGVARLSRLSRLWSLCRQFQRSVQVKFLMTFVFGMLASCSCSLDGDRLRDVPLDSLTVSICENGREKRFSELHLSDPEKARLRVWLKSFAGSNIDFNTYAPAFTLEGQRLRIHFLKDRTVMDYRETDGERWKQYSRPATADDQYIMNWLRETVQ